MRNHRLFGVVIAVLLGISFLHQPPSSPHHDHQQIAGTHFGGPGIQLTSAKLFDVHEPTRLALGEESPVGLLRPAGTRYVKRLVAWMEYQRQYGPPPPPAPALPAPKPTSVVAVADNVAGLT